jgi:nucleoid DNA-binding protein
MSKSVSKKEFIQIFAHRMNIDEEEASRSVEGMIDTFYDVFNQGRGVTLTGFGSFYLDQRGSSCAIKGMNPRGKPRLVFRPKGRGMNPKRFNPSQKLRKLL